MEDMVPAPVVGGAALSGFLQDLGHAFPAEEGVQDFSLIRRELQGGQGPVEGLQGLLPAAGIFCCHFFFFLLIHFMAASLHGLPDDPGLGPVQPLPDIPGEVDALLPVTVPQGFQEDNDQVLPDVFPVHPGLSGRQPAEEGLVAADEGHHRLLTAILGSFQ